MVYVADELENELRRGRLYYALVRTKENIQKLGITSRGYILCLVGATLETGLSSGDYLVALMHRNELRNEHDGCNLDDGIPALD